MSTISSASSQRQLSLNLYNIRAIFRLFLDIILYIYWLDYTTKLVKLRKHIMAVAVQRISQTTLSSGSTQDLSITSSTSSDSEDSCSSSDVITEIENDNRNLRLSFRKVAQKRNLTDDENDGLRGAKSPVIQSDVYPSLFVLPDNHTFESVLPENSFVLKVTARRSSEFNLQLNSINVPAMVECKVVESTQSTKLKRAPKFCPFSPPSSLVPITSEELSQLLLSNSKGLLVVDCRSFMKYNNNHVTGSLNACCTNPTIKKRFSDGKIGVHELISGAENKAKFKEVTCLSECLVVIYDDDAIDLELSQDSNCLGVIASRLSALGLQVKYLNGGLKNFMSKYSHLCTQPIPMESRPLLFSPTSPYVDAAIDTTVMTEILPHLFLGNEKDAANVDKLSEQRFTHILNVSSSIPLYCDLQRPGHFQCLRLPASDSGSQNIKQFFPEAIRFIESAREGGGKVLVHCQAGVSRSPTITIAYLVARFGHPSLEAFGMVKNKRTIVSPNINFMGQLLEFESRSNQIFFTKKVSEEQISVD